MALRIPKIPANQLFKDGMKQYQGLEEAVYRNIQACVELSQMTRTSMGPNGLKKIVINHLEKLFVTNDAATIMKELEVQHPAAKLIVMAAEQQEQEIGDASNFVIVFAGELLDKAEGLLKMGLAPSDVIQGYDLACKYAMEEIQKLAVETIQVPTDIKKSVRTAIASKQYGLENFLSELVTEACTCIMPNNPTNFNVDSVRIVKILGGATQDSKVVKGMVFNREPEGAVKSVKDAKIAIFSCPIDIARTETKGTVLIHNATELLAFSKGEEEQVERLVKEIADAGVNCVVTGSSVGDMAQHFLNKYKIFAIKILSKFELRRLCRVTGATEMARLGAPTKEELGVCDFVDTIEIGGDRVTVFRQENEVSKTATIVLRGGTTNLLDDIERAIDDGVNTVKALTKDGRVVAGAGATEVQLAKKLMEYGKKTPGMNQYAIQKFAEAFQVIPRTLADNAGLNSTLVLSKLFAASGTTIGVNVEGTNEDCTVDAKKQGIYDLVAGKMWGLKYATSAATTVLSVDQIIMSKQAGGPKAPKNKKHWDEDD